MRPHHPLKIISQKNRRAPVSDHRGFALAPKPSLSFCSSRDTACSFRRWNTSFPISFPTLGHPDVSYIQFLEDTFVILRRSLKLLVIMEPAVTSGFKKRVPAGRAYPFQWWNIRCNAADNKKAWESPLHTSANESRQSWYQSCFPLSGLTKISLFNSSNEEINELRNWAS